MRTPIRLLAVASAGLLLISGCSAAPDSGQLDSTMDAEQTSSVDSPPRANVAETGNAAAWCALVPPALIAATLDVRLQEPTASFSAEEVQCDYLPVEDSGPTIDVEFHFGHDHDSFVAYRDAVENESEPSADLTEVGDEAFYRRSEFGSFVTYVVAARQGSVMILVDAPGSLEDVTELVKQVLAKLV